MKLKLVRNRIGCTLITSVLPVTPLGLTDICYLLNVNKDNLNEWLIVGCFLLGITVIYIVLMANNSQFDYLSHLRSAADEINNPRSDLTGKLLAQLIHNNNNTPLTYQNFPSDHPGHLSLHKQTILVSIIRSSSIADEFRYGSSLGKFYIKNTHRHPTVTPEMIGVVLEAESSSN